MTPVLAHSLVIPDPFDLLKIIKYALWDSFQGAVMGHPGSEYRQIYFYIVQDASGMAELSVMEMLSRWAGINHFFALN